MDPSSIIGSNIPKTLSQHAQWVRLKLSGFLLNVTALKLPKTNVGYAAIRHPLANPDVESI